MQEDVAEVLLKPYCSLGVRYTVNKVMEAAWNVALDAHIRLTKYEPLFPNVTHIIDGVPLLTRGPKDFFNGKHKDKYLSFLVSCDVDGTPVSWSGPWEGRIHDSTAFSMKAVGFAGHLQHEYIMGDKAFVGNRHCLCPYKKPPNGELTEKQELFNEHVKMVRNRIESVFARLDKFKLMHYSQHGTQYNTYAMHFMLLVLQIEDIIRRETGWLRYPDSVRNRPPSLLGTDICECTFEPDTEERKAMKKNRDTLATAIWNRRNDIPLNKKKPRKRARNDE